MDSHHAAASGIQALNIRSEQDESTPTTFASRDDDFLQSAGSRKRQKVTHLTTTPSLASDQTSGTILAASDALAEVHAGPNGSGEFDYLLHWERADHDVLDDDELIAGEDDEEEEGSQDLDDDDADDGGHQEDVDMQPATHGRSRLTKDQIVDIINDSIDHYTSTWKPNKNVLKGDEIDYDTEEMWLNAERTGTRHDLIKRYEIDVTYYTQRLNKLCDEILRAPGGNVKDVKQQCRHLEITIDSIELADWLLSIYKLDPTDDEEEDVDSSDLPVVKEGRPILQTPHLQTTVVVDLGSPPDSSDGDDDGMIVDSSPQPVISAGRLFYTPDSVIGDSVAADSVISNSAVPGSATTDSIIGDFVTVDTVEPRIPPISHIDSEGLSNLGARHSTRATNILAPDGFHHGSPARRSKARHSDMPQVASMMTAERWSWDHLSSTNDRKRIVTNVVREMPATDREMVRQRLATVGKADILREIPVCVHMLAKREARMHGVLPRDLPKIVTFTRLFLSWWLCDNYFRVEPSKWDLEELQKCLQEQSPDPSVFYDYLHTIMSTTFSPEALMQPDKPSQAEVVVISDDEEHPTQHRQPQLSSQTQRRRPSQTYTPIILD